MWSNYITLSLLYLLYGLLHSVLAHLPVRRLIIHHTGLSLTRYRLWYNIFAFVSLVLIIWYHINLPRFYLFRSHFLVNLLGILLASSGLGLMLISIRKYFMQLSGISKSRSIPVLETSGIHRYVRHPLYLGTFLFLIGGFLLVPWVSNFLAVIIIILYTITGTRLEERKLVETFGQSYRDYQKSVPMLLPFLK